MKKWLRKVANLRLREGRLFTDDEQPIPELDEKVIFFMLNVNKSFECPDKKEGIRYRRDTLEVLHEKFMCDDDDDELFLWYG